MGVIRKIWTIEWVRERFFRRWGRVPRRLRRLIVSILGGTIIVLGLLLIILPGPFTIPLLALGSAILGTEYDWAKRLMEEGSKNVKKSGEYIKRFSKILIRSLLIFLILFILIVIGVMV